MRNFVAAMLCIFALLNVHAIGGALGFIIACVAGGILGDVSNRADHWDYVVAHLRNENEAP